MNSINLAIQSVQNSVSSAVKSGQGIADRGGTSLSSRSKISVEAALSAAFIAVAALLGFGAVTTYTDTVGLGKAHGWLQQHLTRAVSVELLRGDLSNTRVDQAKYCLTGDLDYLMSAKNFLVEIRQSAGPPEGDKDLEPEVQAQIRKMRKEFDETIYARQMLAVTTYRDSGATAARAVLRASLLASNDDSITQQIIDYRHQQAVVIKRRGAEFEQQIQRTVSGGVFVVVWLGAVILLLFTQRFVKARRRAEETVFMSQQRIKAVADNMLDGLIAIGSDGTIISTNSTASGLFSKRGASLIGANIVDMFCESADGSKPLTVSTLLTKTSGKLVECNARGIHGESFIAEVAVSTISEMGSVAALVTVRDITERVYAEQWKKDFVSTISNDLFAPLAEVQSSLKTIRGQREDIPPKMAEVLFIGERNATRLLGLINDLSDLESLEAGSFQIHPTMSLVPDIVERSLESVRFLAEDKRVALKTSIVAEQVFADPNRIVQVLVNLLSNAIKFSPKDSTIEVSVEVKNAMVMFAVRDHGRGIPKSGQQSVFERYKQSQSSDAIMGTGLGLPICKLIVDRQGGTIGVDSEPGEGSTFWFSLPMAQP